MGFVKFNKDKEEVLDSLNSKSIFDTDESSNDDFFGSKSIFDDDEEEIAGKDSPFSSGTKQVELKRDTKQFEGVADIIVWLFTQIFVVMTNCLLSIQYTVKGFREIYPTLDFIDYQAIFKKITLFSAAGMGANLLLRFFFTENEQMLEVLNSLHNSFIRVVLLSGVVFLGLFLKNGRFKDFSLNSILAGLKGGIKIKKDNKDTDEELESEEIDLDEEVSLDEEETEEEEDDIPKDEIDEQINKDLESDEKREEKEVIDTLSNDYEKTFDEIMAEILGPAEEEKKEEDEEDEEIQDSSDSIDWGASSEIETKPIKMKQEDEQVISPLVINRKALFESFYPLFPSQNPTFGKIDKIESSNPMYGDIMTILVKALANLLSKPIKECSKLFNLLEINNGFLNTEIIISRPKQKIDPEKYAEELKNYSKELLEFLSRKDQLYDDDRFNKISVGINIEGDHYQIVIEKPNKNAVLLGDIFKSKDVRDYMEDMDTELPFIVAVDSLGNPIKANLKDLYYGTIGGPPRSGKTWLLGSTFIQLAITNTPTDLQFIFINPKPDDLFRSAYMLPHTARLIEGSSDENAEEIYDLVCKLEEEITKRQDLFAEKGCANIWEYRDEGETMPALFIQFDEYISIRQMIDNLTIVKKEEEKDLPKEERLGIDYLKSFDGKMKQLLTRAPSSGIFIHLVSHVFTGIINKQDRLLTPYKVVIRGNKELVDSVFDASELTNFHKTLANPGDSVIKLGTMDTSGGKTLGINVKNKDTNNLVKKIAKSYYNMPNLELADKYLQTLGHKYIKNHEEIKDKLNKNN